MSEENIYAAPQSTEVTNQGDESVHTPLTLKQKLWGFEGRISRAGYWGYTYSYYLLMCIPFFIGYALLFIPLVMMESSGSTLSTSSIVIMGVGGLIMLLGMVPMMWMGAAITVKRFHDRGKSGWWALISLIPYVGGIWVLIDCGCLAGDKGKNIYGDDPLLADGKTHL